MTQEPSEPRNTATPNIRQRPRPIVPPNEPSSTPGDNAASEEKVGYGKPPKHSQFKPGFDPRRPKGRKPGAKNMKSAIAAMMESPTTVRTADGGTRTISTAEAIVRKLRELALSGNLGAISKALELQHKFLSLAAEKEEDRTASNAQSPSELAEADRAILAVFEEEIASRKARDEKP